MPTNPLDWPGPPFLALYAGLLIAAILLITARKHTIGPKPTINDRQGLGPVEIAWLTGGRDRALDTIILALLASGAARMDKRGRVLERDAAVQPPPNLRSFAHALSGVATVANVRSALTRQAEGIGDGLAWAGLAPTDAQRTRWHRELAVCFGALFLLGLTKIMVGLSRDRPIGILVVLVFVTVLIALVLSRHPPLSTRTGKAALDAERGANRRAARAPLDDELPFAFALGGGALLAGTPYAALARHRTESGSSGGGTTGCGTTGGDGGSGSGGDSGGGGGCGGCSD